MSIRKGRPLIEVTQDIVHFGSLKVIITIIIILIIITITIIITIIINNNNDKYRNEKLRITK